MKNKTPIYISSYASDEEKKQIEEIFSSFNPEVEKNYITKSIDQQLLQIVVDLSQISIKDIIYGGLIYDLLKTAIKNIYKLIKTKKPIIKLEYKETIIYFPGGEYYYIVVKDKTKANFKDDLYKNKSLLKVFKMIEEELRGEKNKNA